MDSTWRTPGAHINKRWERHSIHASAAPGGLPEGQAASGPHPPTHAMQPYPPHPSCPQTPKLQQLPSRATPAEWAGASMLSAACCCQPLRPQALPQCTPPALRHCIQPGRQPHVATWYLHSCNLPALLLPAYLLPTSCLPACSHHVGSFAVPPAQRNQQEASTHWVAPSTFAWPQGPLAIFLPCHVSVRRPLLDAVNHVRADCCSTAQAHTPTPQSPGSCHHNPLDHKKHTPDHKSFAKDVTVGRSCHKGMHVDNNPAPSHLHTPPLPQAAQPTGLH